MFYQVREGDKVISTHKYIRQACADVAANPATRKIVGVKYQGSVLKVVHEYSQDEFEQKMRRLAPAMNP